MSADQEKVRTSGESPSAASPQAGPVLPTVNPATKTEPKTGVHPAFYVV